MIDFGIIAYGGELRRKPIYSEIDRLRKSMAGMAEPPSAEIVYVIPGSVGGPDFEGFQLKRSRTGSRHPIIFVEVPAELASSPKPLPALFELARSAIRYMQEHSNSSSKSATIDFAELDEAIASAARELLGRSWVAPTPARRKTVGAAQEHPTSEPASVELRLSVSNQREIEEAFRLEARIERLLEKTSLGLVDGNEVGQGEFAIFTYGDDLARLRSEVEAVVRQHWPHQGATLTLSDENTRETIIL